MPDPVRQFSHAVQISGFANCCGIMILNNFFKGLCWTLTRPYPTDRRMETDEEWESRIERQSKIHVDAWTSKTAMIMAVLNDMEMDGFNPDNQRAVQNSSYSTKSVRPILERLGFELVIDKQFNPNSNKNIYTFVRFSEKFRPTNKGAGLSGARSAALYVGTTITFRKDR